MRIAVDLDETLVDLCTKWCYYRNNKYGSDFTRETMGYNNCVDDTWMEFLRIPGFLADLPYTDPAAPKVLRRWKEQGHELIVVTSAVAWECARDKYQWVHTHLKIPGLIDSMGQLVITRRKDLIRADVLVDDGPENIKAFAKAGGSTVCYDRPWNSEFNEDYRHFGSVSHYRAHGWEAVEDIVDCIEWAGRDREDNRSQVSSAEVWWRDLKLCGGVEMRSSPNGVGWGEGRTRPPISTGLGQSGEIL